MPTSQHGKQKPTQQVCRRLHYQRGADMPAIQPDRATLEIAHAAIQNRPLSLDAMLANPAQKIIIENEARIHLRKCQQFDAQKARCGDKD
jgi:hypothetical protein